MDLMSVIERRAADRRNVGFEGKISVKVTPRFLTSADGVRMFPQKDKVEDAKVILRRC